MSKRTAIERVQPNDDVKTKKQCLFENSITKMRETSLTH